MTDSSAVLSVHGDNVSLPVYSGTLGPDVVDVSTLNKQDVFTYDPGFMSTAACDSKITYIDGDQGILLYRGYLIDCLADKHDFMDIAYLLFFGELPDTAQKTSFITAINQHLQVQSFIPAVFNALTQNAHPMGMLVSSLGALSAQYRGDMKSSDGRLQSAYFLIAQMPILAALCLQHSQGCAIASPDKNIAYAQNVMHMLFGASDKQTMLQPVMVRAMDKILILHADHEQNASTSTVRMVGSTGANPIASLAAGVAALWGPAHGGANEACLNMLLEIGDESNISHYIARAKDKNDPFRLMGFGHRVYKNYDPRAKVMRATCHEVLDALGVKDDKLFKLAMKLEKIALEDEYFVERKLYPNVDFYSGITLNALGIPTNMFTVIFALARTVGWLAHWMEMLDDPQHKIARPRQLYTGAKQRSC